MNPRVLIPILILILSQSLAHANGVDSHQFGMLTTGMPEQEIVRRLGQPDTRSNTIEVVCTRESRGETRCQQISVSRWTYSGDGHLMPTSLSFRDGVLTHKHK